MATNNGLNINAANPLSSLLGGTGTSSAEPVDEQVQQGQFNFAASTGAADAYAVALTPAVTVLTDGLQVVMVANHGNTTPTPTLSVNGLPAATIVLEQGVPLLEEDIVLNSTYILVYNLSNNTFQLINPTFSAANTSLVQANSYSYAIDTGVADAYVADLNPAPPAPLTPGMIVYLEVGDTNTGASTFELNGAIATPIVTNASAPLVAGDMVANGLSVLMYSGLQNAWVLINPAVTPGTGTVNTGTANEIAYYAGNGSVVSGTTSLPTGTTLNSVAIATTVNGTFAPGIEFGGLSTGITYVVQSGYYSHVGGVVTFQIYIQLSSKGSATGAAAITNFPVASRATGAAASLCCVNMASATVPANTVVYGSIIGSSDISLLTNQDGATLDDTIFTNGTELFISGSYLA